MKKELPMPAVVAIIVVVVVVLGGLIWHFAGQGSAPAEHKKYMDTLELTPGQSVPAPPPPGGSQ